MSDDDFQPIETLKLTVTLADGTTVVGTVADRPTTGLFWRFEPGSDRHDRNRLLDLMDAAKLIMGEFNANGGELHNLLDLPEH